jgi:hypothetical protein
MSIGATMTDLEYKTTLLNAIRRLREATKLRDETEAEIVKLRQFVRATANMLSEKDRADYNQMIVMMDLHDGLRRAGLHDAVRRTLAVGSPKFFTAAQVRDQLRFMGFDFSSYRSNPLASVSTTLRRFSRREVEVTDIDGVAAYRWKNTQANRKKQLEWEQFDALCDGLEAEKEIGEGESIDKPE